MLGTTAAPRPAGRQARARRAGAARRAAGRDVRRLDKAALARRRAAPPPRPRAARAHHAARRRAPRRRRAELRVRSPLARLPRPRRARGVRQRRAGGGAAQLHPRLRRRSADVYSGQRDKLDRAVRPALPAAAAVLRPLLAGGALHPLRRLPRRVRLILAPRVVPRRLGAPPPPPHLLLCLERLLSHRRGRRRPRRRQHSPLDKTLPPGH
mmetsp:Transcript_51931/g.168924  ORF Transcript_51931/g.168924 Transcript_51931/m.168924 type:complete len:210 (+) Transcript_51931:2-631(+)